MRSALALILGAGLIACAGCVTGGAPLDMKPAPAVEIVNAAPPVAPDSVTEDNYRACAKRLRDELDREEQRIQLSKSVD